MISTGESSLTIRRGEHIEGDDEFRQLLVRAITAGFDIKAAFPTIDEVNDD